MAQPQDDLTCRELVELVTENLEDALAPAERARFEAHLAGCRGCRIHLDQVRRTVAVVRASAERRERPEIAALTAAFRDRNRSA